MTEQELKEKLAKCFNDRVSADDGGWCEDETCEKYEDNCGLCIADKLLAIVKEEIGAARFVGWAGKP